MGLVYGSQYFFKLFEYKALISPFRFGWVLGLFSIIRIFAPDTVGVFIIPLAVWFLIDVIINFLCIFSEYFIVLRDQGVFQSVKSSMKMVFMNLEDVAMVIFLMLLVAARVIINALLVLGLPMLIIFVGSFVASSFMNIAIILGSILGVALLFLISYINGIITVFTTSAWELFFFHFEDPEAAHALTEAMQTETSDTELETLTA